MEVIKIGGASLESYHSFDKIASMILDPTLEYFLIISAFGKTTSKLREIAELSLREYSKSKSMLKELRQYFEGFFLSSAFGINSQNIISDYIDYQFTNLSKILHSVSITEELSKRTLDKILSYGEVISTKIIYEYLSQNFDVEYISAEEHIITNSNFGNAIPNYDLSKSKLENFVKISQNRLFIMEGFIASDSAGNTTTMGFESSNLTATIVCKSLNSDRLSIITNVEGIRSADPKVINATKLIPNMSYEQASILSNLGLKLIYNESIKLAKTMNMEIIYKSFHSEGQTIIDNKKSEFSCLLIDESAHQIIIYNLSLHSFLDFLKHSDIKSKSEITINQSDLPIIKLKPFAKNLNEIAQLLHKSLF